VSKKDTRDRMHRLEQPRSQRSRDESTGYVEWDGEAYVGHKGPYVPSGVVVGPDGIARRTALGQDKWTRVELRPRAPGLRPQPLGHAITTCEWTAPPCEATCLQCSVTYHNIAGHAQASGHKTGHRHRRTEPLERRRDRLHYPRAPRADTFVYDGICAQCGTVSTNLQQHGEATGHEWRVQPGDPMAQ